jgi:hypothetical protein
MGCRNRHSNRRNRSRRNRRSRNPGRSRRSRDPYRPARHKIRRLARRSGNIRPAVKIGFPREADHTAARRPEWAPARAIRFPVHAAPCGLQAGFGCKLLAGFDCKRSASFDCRPLADLGCSLLAGFDCKRPVSHSIPAAVRVSAGPDSHSLCGPGKAAATPFGLENPYSADIVVDDPAGQDSHLPLVASKWASFRRHPDRWMAAN